MIDPRMSSGSRSGCSPLYRGRGDMRPASTVGDGYMCAVARLRDTSATGPSASIDHDISMAPVAGVLLTSRASRVHGMPATHPRRILIVPTLARRVRKRLGHTSVIP
jgi:hypothetical protein